MLDAAVGKRGDQLIRRDGCFWHGCPQCCRRPSSNTRYWNAKIERNTQRDGEQTRRLVAAGWTVVRIWGHDVERDLEGAALRVGLALGGES